MNRILTTTHEGSHTLFVPQLNEYYHSIHGAVQESMHVFIQAGLQKVLENEHLTDIHIFEMGLGTGLNALLTYCTLIHMHPAKHCRVHYVCIEAYPLENEVLKQLNYLSQLPEQFAQYTQRLNTFFEKIHETPFNLSHFTAIDNQFFIKKIHQQLEHTLLPTNYFDLIYYDAFAPSAQPHLWEKAIFEKLYTSLTNNGILTTYCAKGVIKRTIKEVGFVLESLPGPIHKREMTRALKIVE